MEESKAPGNGPPVRAETGFSLGFADASVVAGGEAAEGPSEPASAAGTFVLRTMIGAGGQGEVWEAWQPTLRRTVAVKIHRSGSVERFAREALITGELEHPAIVPVLEFGTLARDSSGPPAVAMVMKRLRGARWDELIAADHAADLLPGPEALARHFAIFEAVCQAVAFAHSRGIVHLDLKPSQVIVGEFGETWLCDWGMAARLIPDRGPEFVTPPASSFGTPGFMAPEQALCDLEALGFRTDVYLMAGVLFHVLTGRLPHPGATPEEMVQAARRNELQPLPPGLPASLRAVVTRGLASRPADRPESIEALRREARQALDRLSQEAEALRLAADAARQLQGVERELDYATLSAVEQNLERAMALAPEDPEVRRQHDLVLTRHADLALTQQDLALAQVMADRLRDPAERQRVAARVAEARAASATREAQRVRARRAAMAALLALLVVLAGSAAFLYLAFTRAAFEGRRAESALADSRRELARASIQAAMAHLDKLRPADAREALRHVPPELRGWEWGFLASRAVPEARLLRPRSESFHGLAVSPDGTIVGALRESDGALLVVPTGEGNAREDQSQRWSAVAPDTAGGLLAGSESGRLARVLVTSTELLPDRLAGPITLVAGVGEGVLLAVDGTGRLWRLGGGNAEALTAPGERVTVLQSREDAFAAGLSSGELVHGLRGTDPVRSLARHRAPVVGIAWDRTRPRFVSWAGALAVPGQEDSRAIVSEAGNADPLHVTYETDFPVTAAAWSSDGRAIGLAMGNAWLHELSTATWSVARSTFHDLGVATALCYPPEGRAVVLLSRGQFQVRETEWLGRHMVQRADSRRIRAWAHAGNLLYLCGDDGGLSAWRYDQGADRNSFPVAPDLVSSLDSVPGSSRVAAAHRWGWIFPWNIAAAPVRETGSWADLEVRQLRLSADGSRVAAISADGRVELADLTTARSLASHRTGRPLRAVAMHPAGGRALVAPADGGLLVVEAGAVGPVLAGNAPRGPWTALEFIESGDTLAAAGADGSIHLLRAADLSALHVLRRHTRPVRRLQAEPGGRWLVSAGEDEIACLWDLQERRLERVFQGSHAGPVIAALLTADGKRLITACEDTLIHVFDRASGAELCSFEGHSFAVTDLVAAPDGRRLMSTGLDGYLKVWNPLPWEEGDSVLEADPSRWRPAVAPEALLPPRGT